ncbi:MAG: hypothetical protein P4L45_15580 [Ignavibacteriaceae bacterium]|nr:hypothetical protein [Ignavibacteriaceae bacterium]
MKKNAPLRFVDSKIISYDLHNGNKLAIVPVPYYQEDGFNLEMGIEKYQIETNGDFNIKNIQKSSLKNFTTFLFNYLPALKQLS